MANLVARVGPLADCVKPKLSAVAPVISPLGPRAAVEQSARRFLAGAEPRPDEGDKAEDECCGAVFGVVVVAAGLVAWEERRELVGGAGEVEHCDNDQDDAEYDE